MAVKDHSLDDKITKAAFEEFLRLGFREASINQIAKNAGVTTGAIYTRYKNKDELFGSLVQDMLKSIGEKSVAIAELYYDVQKSFNPQKMIDVIKQEEKLYIDMMFRHYDECILFFCKSEGSSVADMVNTMMDRKAEETAEYLKKISKNDIDYDGIKLIMSEQFHFYRQILERGYTKEKAVSCMETVELFLEAGWKAVFETILQ